MNEWMNEWINEQIDEWMNDQPSMFNTPVHNWIFTNIPGSCVNIKVLGKLTCSVTCSPTESKQRTIFSNIS